MTVPSKSLREGWERIMEVTRKDMRTLKVFSRRFLLPSLGPGHQAVFSICQPEKPLRGVSREAESKATFSLPTSLPSLASGTYSELSRSQHPQTTTSEEENMAIHVQFTPEVTERPEMTNGDGLRRNTCREVSQI